MRNFSDEEFLKLFRKLVYWEWYKDVNTFKLFMHCLIMANWKDGRWKGIEYKRGQFITSIANLAKDTGLTIQQTKTALKHLQLTNEVTSKTTNKYTVITVVSFDKYQGEQQTKQQTNNKQNNKQNNKEVTKNQQQNKNNKNNKNISEEKYIEAAPPDGGGSDGKGEIPEGWTEKDEEEFQMMYEDNNWKTRKAWAEYWKDGEE